MRARRGHLGQLHVDRCLQFFFGDTFQQIVVIGIDVALCFVLFGGFVGDGFGSLDVIQIFGFVLFIYVGFDGFLGFFDGVIRFFLEEAAAT